MSELEHISSILVRAINELVETWGEQREEEEIEPICQESAIEADRA